MAAALLTVELTAAVENGTIAVASAGSNALIGAPACPVMRDLAGATPLTEAQEPPGLPESYRTHSARRLISEQLTQADLILAMDRSHSGAIAQLAPAVRSKTFTLRQAASLVTAVATAFASGELPVGAPPLPAKTDTSARLQWVVGELDAARGVTPMLPDPEMLEQDTSPFDVADPHEIGTSYHPVAARIIVSATKRIAEGLAVGMRA
jgi:protein-tyrosine phosphatase